jgi:cytochrome c55X
MAEIRAAFGVLILMIPTLTWAAPDATRQSELRYLLRQDCGSCHGMTMKGGLGPALLPQTLKDRPHDVLVAAVLEGRPGTPMPAWRNLLSEDEVHWLVSGLRSGDLP